MTVKDYLSLKAGSGSKQSYWHYSGVMRNPLTGAEVVGIEGVEIVRPIRSIAGTHNISDSADDYTRSYLSKKLFMYVDRTNRSSLINEYRLLRQAPLRPVTPSKQFAELVTLSVDSVGHMFASVSWPGSHRTISTNKIRILPAAGADSVLDQIRGRKKLNVVNFMTAGVPIGKIPKNSIRRWVSFSPSGESEGAGRSQEYYTISNGDAPAAGSPAAVVKQSVGKPGWKALFGPQTARPEAVMTYQRHGEGPAWYSVGRACVIELSGARYSSVKCLPSYVRELVSRAQPDFFDLSLPPVLSDGHQSNDTVRSGEAGVSIKRKNALLTQEWFAHQSDPLDNFKPWYTNVRNYLSSLRKGE